MSQHIQMKLPNDTDATGRAFCAEGLASLEEELHSEVYQGLSHALVLPWNERYTQHLDFISNNIKEIVSSLSC